MESLSSQEPLGQGMGTIWRIPVFILTTLLAAFMTRGIYNVYFHPLSKYPGPFLATFSEAIYWYKWVRGDLIPYIDAVHRAYGNTTTTTTTVRLAPNRLSYISAAAWKDIYGHKTAARQLHVTKDPQLYIAEGNGRRSLLSTLDDGAHGALRKMFAHGFSDRALKAQEDIIHAHVDKLVGAVRRLGTETTPIDMCTLFNCATWDIIGELAFGQSLGLLDAGALNAWVASIFASLQLGPFVSLAAEYPLLGKAVGWLLLPQRIKDGQAASARYSGDLVEARLARGRVTAKPDFWTLVLARGEADGGGALDVEDMKANANLFMGAGSETTATMLSGLWFNLLRNPDKFARLLDEVRGAFAAEDEFTIENIQRLEYLAACFNESMRLYPSTPLGGPRIVMNSGGEINGEFVPPNTKVSVAAYTAYRSPVNFTDNLSFVPERWIPTHPLYERYADDNRAVFQPFSYGPRNCIGKNLALHEMRLIAVKLLWSFDFELCEETGDWFKQKMYWALWHKPPLWVRAKPIVRQGESAVDAAAA